MQDFCLLLIYRVKDIFLTINVRNMKKLLFIATLLAGLCWSCDNNTPDMPTPPEQWIDLDSRTQEEMAENGNIFATNLMVQMNQQIPDKNMMISPMSLQFALGMLSNGADEVALKEITDAMGLNDYSLMMMNSYYYNLAQQLKKKDKNFTLSLANAIWVQENYEIGQEFIQNNQDFFDAKVANIDFTQKDKAKETINRWANDATKGTIKEVSFSINDLTRIVLANACYLKGKWATPFKEENTKKKMFHNQNGTTGIVDMMHLTETFGFCNHEDYPFMAVELPYCNKNFSMLVVLPNEDKSLEEILATIEWSNIPLASREVEVQLPKFKIEANYPEEIQNCVKEMGIERIFEAGSLQGINRELFVSQITQDTFIHVDESGTEASAVTNIGGDIAAAPPAPVPLICMDRPFAFAIRENTNGAILFMGKVVKM